LSVKITVRGAPVGGHAGLTTDHGDGVLMQFAMDRRLELGERLHLPDGTLVEVIGCEEPLLAVEECQTVLVRTVSIA
jgi:hypothetical protein